ncbi:MAG TPA: efflux RND transporter periplasmic adaptor subunit [Anaeromyxobacteraceae bacterium]|nr:efflux RND transporter periplasmic adaptor subunit [Anaeromyxobacteraceae bacterium]
MSSPRYRTAYYLAGIGAAAAAVAAVVGLALTSSSRARAETAARIRAAERGPHVQVASVRAAQGTRDLRLQAEAQPYASVTLYAKISGYLRSIKVDKGDRVRKDQVIAVLESPELDQQVRGARADALNKEVMAKRARALVGSGVVSQQDFDSAIAGSEVAEATLKSLTEQQSYEILRSPFDGTVTARFADDGALLQAATSSQTTALPVVTIADIDRLRIYAYVDQREAAFVADGTAAQVSIPERPGTTFPGVVTRRANELDARTRTMLVEVDLDNRKHLIVPGSFVEVTLRVPGPTLVDVPAQALVLRGTKTFVAVVTPDNHVRFRPVKLFDHDGTRVRVLEGLEGSERVALSLGEDVEDGGPVQPLAEEKARD